MPELGDYVRLIRRINSGYESVSAGEVFEVIDVMCAARRRRAASVLTGAEQANGERDLT